MHTKLSLRLQNKVALVAEFSGRPICVTLILTDGRRVRNVIISRDSVIERVGVKEIKEEKDLDFPLAQIQDLDLAGPGE